MIFHTISFSIVLLLAANACSEKNKNDSSVTVVDISEKILVSNLENPWEILWGPDNHIWMTERGGRISRVNPATGGVIPVITIAEVKEQGEGGLLGMALHPDFKTTPHVFVAYNYGNYREKVVRFTYSGNTLTNPITLIDNIDAAGIHNGCRLIITPGLKLFITTGDAATQSYPQNKSSLNGKVLRINLDGSIPNDNPFAGSPVWSFGHRNAQGLVFANNILYSSEHGPDTDDEVNIIEKGRNFGWPHVRGYCDNADRAFCTANNVKEPIQEWTPTVAVCGLDFYNNDLIPGWKNSLLLCTLKESTLFQLKLNDAHNAVTKTNEYLVRDYGRLRDVCISPDLKVYVCTSNGNNDKIIEISGK